jgi:CheY-like chemotaxis protein
MTPGTVENLHVIYIDDDETNLTVVRDILTCFGSAVTVCRRPAEALDLLAARPFHVALVDIHMPEMSGIEFLLSLRREIGPNRATPAIALTADVSRDEVQYRELGFDGFIAKPVLVKNLLLKILEVLTRRKEAEASARWGEAQAAQARAG